MTTAEQLLGLANTAFPDIDYRLCRSPFGDYVQSAKTFITFDPANNADQFCDVLAWLLRQDYCNEVNGEYVLFYPNHNPLAEPLRAEYDGTASGLRQAVTDAAVRVCMGVGK